MPRLLTIMGSGETAPTMVKVHRDLIEAGGTPAVLLDTPFGFQANADDLVAKAQTYFRDSVGVDLELASYRSSAVVGVALERTLARLREARYVFAGPGSPSYALRQWAGSPVVDVLCQTLATGGAVTFASAAALTAGVVTVPVYEIYKVGADPHWLPGLDLLALAGLRAAVVPHYNNAEGGSHDTRFCYLGEERLRAMEATLPDGAFVLGVDEHTAAVLDLDAGTARVVGLGTVTVRLHGRSTALPSGSVVPISDLATLVGASAPSMPSPVSAAAPPSAAAQTSLADVVDHAGREFARALDVRDVTTALGLALDLELQLDAWSQDSTQSDAKDRGRALLRSMLVRLGDLAQSGTADPRVAVAPYVDLLLALRTEARDDRRWAESDRLRDALVAAGVDVRDTESGSEWSLRAAE